MHLVSRSLLWPSCLDSTQHGVKSISASQSSKLAMDEQYRMYQFYILQICGRFRGHYSSSPQLQVMPIRAHLQQDMWYTYVTFTLYIIHVVWYIHIYTRYEGDSRVRGR